ncbi:MAG: putative baseplate assembly protein [Cyanobacteria bacterium P01_F01_bin.56]
MERQHQPTLDALKILPELPKPNLDDRTFKDLVDEGVLRIPRYCPEWTNHNPADPGITLIEVFAWLTDQMLWRFNQVPWRQYIAFLELLGIRLAPPKPAKTEITFYLTRGQKNQNTIPSIPIGTEVATERTENQQAIIFSTEHSLDIGVPRIRNFLIANQILPAPTSHLGHLRDGFNRWSPEHEQGDVWSGRSQAIFQDIPQRHNGFYLVLGAATMPDGQPQRLDGHVIELDITGQLAGPTGINPKRPPRRWEAWNGETWQSVLLTEDHDETFGFSFDETGQSLPSGPRRASVMLHMPLTWPETTFHSDTGAPYTGFWLRCVYDQPHHLRHTEPEGADASLTYRRSPQFTGLAVRAIGGTIPATQCTFIHDELLGESTGKPGQQFSLQSAAILERHAEEHLRVIPPGAADLEDWTEVPDFADSSETDRHYTLDSRTGVLQLGPLVREPAQLKAELQLRREIQRPGQDSSSALDSEPVLQRQYGYVPPKGVVLRMTAYRTGGGEAGNIQQGALRILKSAIPYVARVTNHKAASGGANAETLEQAVMRVPRLLRTRDRAITPEDFETLAQQANGKIRRAHCLPVSTESAGRVTVLLVPDYPVETTHHQRFELPIELRDTVEQFLQERSLLGIAIQTQTPEYVRVKVQIQLLLEASYRQHEAVKDDIQQTVKQHLYHFINPLTGGWDGTGWEFGAALHKTDIIGYLHKQPVAGVRSVGDLQLFCWDREASRWTLQGDEVRLTPLQLLDSWETEDAPATGHGVELI